MAVALQMPKLFDNIDCMENAFEKSEYNHVLKKEDEENRIKYGIIVQKNVIFQGLSTQQRKPCFRKETNRLKNGRK